MSYNFPPVSARRMFRKVWFPGFVFLFFYLFLVFFTSNTSAEPKKSEEKRSSDNSPPSLHPNSYFYQKDSPWHLSVYGGRYTETDLLPILFQQKTRYKDSHILVVGLSKPLDFQLRFINFEVEGNLTKHFGIMQHWELNALYIARIKNPFGLPMSIAIGEGLSLASRNPLLENRRVGLNLDNFTIQTRSIKSRNLLNFVMTEFELGREDSDWPRVFMRVHHRSGVFGLYCQPDPACGSNFVSFGVRQSIDRIIGYIPQKSKE